MADDTTKNTSGFSKTTNDILFHLRFSPDDFAGMDESQIDATITGRLREYADDLYDIFMPWREDIQIASKEIRASLNK